MALNMEISNFEDLNWKVKLGSKGSYKVSRGYLRLNWDQKGDPMSFNSIDLRSKRVESGSKGYSVSIEVNAGRIMAQGHLGSKLLVVKSRGQWGHMVSFTRKKPCSVDRFATGICQTNFWTSRMTLTQFWNIANLKKWLVSLVNLTRLKKI